MAELPGWLPPRWRKVARDLWTERGRGAALALALAVSLTAVGAVLGAYSVLTRSIAASYLGTRPAEATLELPGGVDAAALRLARSHPLVEEAEAREVIVARARVGDEWRRALLFVVADFDDLRLNTFRRTAGSWPPPPGTVLIERSAEAMVDAGVGDRVVLKPPHGPAREVTLSGQVHDPGLAPAWQERTAYLYLTRETLALLGEPPLLGELRIALRGHPRATATVEAQAAQVAASLGAAGLRVEAIRVPPPGQHPHQRQMTTILLLMLGFAVTALLLSAVLTATSLAALLARQVREIGVLKTLGAGPWAIAALYAAMVGTLGLAALLPSLPAACGGARVFLGAIPALLNFDVDDARIPAWVVAVQVAAGLLVPLVVAAVPIRRAATTSVRAALAEHGAGGERFRAWLALLPAWLRAPLRRPLRLALTLGLLASGGALFVTAIDVERGWQAMVATIYRTRSYDVEALLQRAAPADLPARLASLPSVRAVETWGTIPAAFARPGQIDVVRTYPDRGHGSLVALAPPPATRMVAFPVRAGRWLLAGDRGAVVLSHGALAQAPWLRVGDAVTLSLGGTPVALRLVGVVEEIGSAGVAYVDGETFAGVTRAAGAARLLRLSTTARTGSERAAAMREIERAMDASGIDVESVTPLSELRTAVGDHIEILVRSLTAMALILAIVGAVGLASTMGVSVVERTGELAVTRTLGATPARLRRMLLGEGLVIGAMSWLLAVALAVPLTLAVGGLVGRLGFLAPLPLVISPGAALLWAILLAVVSTIATLVPTRRAVHMSIRDALARP